MILHITKKIFIPPISNINDVSDIYVNLYNNTIQINDVIYPNLYKYNNALYSGEQEIINNECYFIPRKIYFTKPNFMDVYNFCTDKTKNSFDNFACSFKVDNLGIYLLFNKGITVFLKNTNSNINDKYSDSKSSDSKSSDSKSYIKLTKCKKRTKYFTAEKNDIKLKIIYNTNEIYVKQGYINKKCEKNKYITKLVYNYNKNIAIGTIG